MPLPLSGRKALQGVLRAGEATARAPSALGGPARALGATPGRVSTEGPGRIGTEEPSLPSVVEMDLSPKPFCLKFALSP